MKKPNPPVAPVHNHKHEIHGHTRIDPYFWLRERDNPEVQNYLEAENNYLSATMGHTRAFQKQLFDEIKGRIKEDDSSVPFRENGYWYYTRYKEGKAYPIFCRKEGNLEADEHIMLDVNALAEGQDYFSVNSWTVSEDSAVIAYAQDTQGRRIHTIHFKNLATGERYADVIPHATGNMAWANDSKTLFYSRQDPQTLRYYRIYRHKLGMNPEDDVLVYEEPDETFFTRVMITKSKKYLLIRSSQTLSTEYQYLDANTPEGSFQIIHPRERELEYFVDHFEDHFYIQTNQNATNFKLMRTSIDATEKEHWEEVIPHREDVLLEYYEIFKDYLVLAERKNGLMELRVRPWSHGDEHYIAFDDPAYYAYTSINPEFDTPILRYGYTSMTTPRCTYDYNMDTRERVLLKQQEVLGSFNQEDYQTDRLYAPARDGANIPISLVYRKDTPIDGSAPLLLYSYGSYGASLDAAFSSPRLSLLDRGFVFAIAHIRGGEELGRAWYENGKLLNKKNTFTDFIDAAEYLIEKKYTNPSQLFAKGGSAGGLLIGAVINMRPDLWKAVIADVPFVDVVTTMLDDSIPLTTNEYDEWGNPNDPAYYEYILSYSPYDNVEAKDYPHMLVTAGLHDSQVQYWEPAKWVAKLRANKTDQNLLLLKTNMEAGHSGASGRYERYREVALDYAFLLEISKNP